MPTKQAEKTEKLWPPKFLVVLATIFLTIWIIVGLFFFLVIASQIRQGVFKGLFAKPQNQQTVSQQATSPQEADLPGVGKVNIECVRSALSQESIGKIAESGNASSLSVEDKEKLDKCVAEKAPESPQPSPTS